jgi:hypothetical protein
MRMPDSAINAAQDHGNTKPAHTRSTHVLFRAVAALMVLCSWLSVSCRRGRLLRSARRLPPTVPLFPTCFKMCAAAGMSIAAGCRSAWLSLWSVHDAPHGSCASRCPLGPVYCAPLYEALPSTSSAVSVARMVSPQGDWASFSKHPCELLDKPAKTLRTPTHQPGS